MDVIDLREFYSGPLGATARRLVMHRIRTRIRTPVGGCVVGLGYATPYIEGWRDGAEAVVGFMPARQGVVRWPDNGLCASALVDETDLPLSDNSVDVMVVVHGLETADDPPGLLREAWRVLASGGRLLLVVANRRGVWASVDATPFGQGRPFSRRQLTSLLREARFSPAGWSHALFVPPIDRAFLRRSAAAWERVGLWLWPALSGVIIVEATKQVYATVSDRKRKRLARLRPSLAPVPHGATPHLPRSSPERPA